MNSRRLLVLLIFAGIILAACGEPTPIPVYVTPTPQATTLAPSQTPTETPSPTSTSQPTFTITPVPTSTLTATATPPPSLTPLPTGLPASATASPTMPPGVTYGPVVGPDYTLAPTETRVPPTLPPTVLPTEGPSPTPIPGLRRALMGVQIHPNIDSPEFDRVLGLAKDLNVAWIKLQFNWSLLESAPGKYTELLYLYRLYVQRAHDQGFQVMVSVAKAPGWARSAGGDGALQENGPPADPQTLANFLAGMLDLFGKDMYGKPYISAVEVWNEPNLQREWYGYPITGTAYMQYFRPAFDAIYQYSPDIVVITAAPAPTGDSAWSTDDRRWLQQLYDAGLASYGQNVAVGIHPYGWANPPEARCCANPSRGWDDRPQFFFLDTIEDYHQIMLANGHSNAQLWTTEFGWATFDGLTTSGGARPTDPPDTAYFGFINQWQQADYTLRAFLIAQERPYMGPVILWNLNFATSTIDVDKSDPQTGYGMIDTHWQPRPVYSTLKDAPKN